MKPFIEWFTLLLVTLLAFGWLQWGVCWILCETVIEDQKYFWPMMGIPMTFDMCFSLMWAGGVWKAAAKAEAEAEAEAEELKEWKKERGF
jgi:hypothetical protein